MSSKAVAEAFWKAKTPRQQIATAVVAILCSVPGRISELLELPVDCDVVLDPGDGYQAGLRWWPKKGGIPQVKYVPKAMVPVVEEALARIKRHTDLGARIGTGRTIRKRANSQTPPEGWPIVPGDTNLSYDRALMVTHPHVMSSKKEPQTDAIEPITYHPNFGGASGHRQRKYPVRLRGNGNPAERRLAADREHPQATALPLNTIANKASVPQADIALWSGRKKLPPEQHIRSRNGAGAPRPAFERPRGSAPSLPIPIDEQTSFDIAQIKENRSHNPVRLVHSISAAEPPARCLESASTALTSSVLRAPTGKLDNIKRELGTGAPALRKGARTDIRRPSGLRRVGRSCSNPKIARLEQLVDILENDEIVEGSPVFMTKMGALPQFDPAWSRKGHGHVGSTSRANEGKVRCRSRTPSDT